MSTAYTIAIIVHTSPSHDVKKPTKREEGAGMVPILKLSLSPDIYILRKLICILCGYLQQQSSPC